MRGIDAKALIQLKATRHRLTAQQYRTLRGQVLARGTGCSHEGAAETFDDGGRKKMTDQQIIHSLRCCNADDGNGCQNCDMNGNPKCASSLRTMAACRLAELSRAVEQKGNVSQETANSQEETPETGVQLEPERATEYISISVAEYHCLTKAATMLEVILAADEYDAEKVVRSCRSVIEDMHRIAEGREDQ